MTTVTHPAPPDPEAEPATMPLPRRQPGRTYPGRPPVERRPEDLPPSTTALIALLAAATGVC